MLGPHLVYLKDQWPAQPTPFQLGGATGSGENLDGFGPKKAAESGGPRYPHDAQHESPGIPCLDHDGFDSLGTRCIGGKYETHGDFWEMPELEVLMGKSYTRYTWGFCIAMWKTTGGCSASISASREWNHKEMAGKWSEVETHRLS